MVPGQGRAVDRAHVQALVSTPDLWLETQTTDILGIRRLRGSARQWDVGSYGLYSVESHLGMRKPVLLFLKTQFEGFNTSWGARPPYLKHG